MLDSLCRDVILDLRGHAVIGNGTGIGILILKSAHDTTVQGSDSSETGQAIFNGRGTGLEDDGNKCRDRIIPANRGHQFNQQGHGGDAIVLQNASGVTVANFKASFNGGTGVNVQGGSNNRIRIAIR